GARAQTVLRQRQKLSDAHAAHSVPGGGRAVLRGLSADRALHALAHRAPVEAGAQLAQRVLRWLASEPRRTDHPLPLLRLPRGGSDCGGRWGCATLADRMAIRVETAVGPPAVSLR